MKKIAVLTSGGGTNLQAIIDAKKNGFIKNGEISLVIASKSESYAVERAKHNSIKAFVLAKKEYPDRQEYTEKVIALLEENDIDIVVLAGFMVVLHECFIKKYENRIINVHPALIPAFCGMGFYGLHVHEAVLERGVKLTGATVHFVNEITDGGPIIMQKAVEVKNGDTPEVLQKRVMQEAEWVILPKTLELLCDDKIFVKNNIAYVME